MLALGLALVGALAHCGSNAPEPGVDGPTSGTALPGTTRPGAGGKPPSILLVVLDTVRADRLTCYGHDRPTTPRICAAAEGGIRFRHAFANSSWTLPSHASLLTGLHSAAHRATQETLSLDEGPPTLAGLLAAAGYVTWGASANPVVGPGTGLDRGFETFLETWRRERQARYPEHPNNLAFAEFLRRDTGGAPFFAFLNYVEAHTPYMPPPEIARRFVSADHSREEIAEAARLTMADHYLRGPLTPDQLAVLGELYEGEIAFLDDLVADLLARLEAAGLDRSTWVVITSDHGEHLGEHGHFDHVFSLSDTLLRVPLILLPPAGSGDVGERADPAQLLDLFPTLLALAGVPPPADRYTALRTGRDLLAARTGPPDGPIAPPTSPPLLAEYYYPRQVLSVLRPDEVAARRQALMPYMRRLRALRQGDRKLVWGSDGRHELYDLASDPAERHSLIDDPAHQQERERLMAVLREQVRRVMGEPPLDPPPPPGWMMPGFQGDRLDEETRQRLRSLGYID